jgi:flagellar basal body-associated protein FliL
VPQPGQPWPGYGPPDPYAQQPDPYAQQPDPYAQQPGPYVQQPDPYAQPTSGMPYGPPTQPGPPVPPPPQYPTGPVSAQPYPTSGQPFPTAPQPYAQPGPPGQAAYPTSGQPAYPTSGMPISPAAGQTTSFMPDPYGQGAYPGTGFLPPQPQPKKRGLMITMIILGVVLVLFGGGGAAAFFVLRDSGGPGKSSPVEAVNEFLTAVYKNKDVEAAEKAVCGSSRNKNALIKRIDEIKKYESNLKEPTYTWGTPTVETQNASSATLNVQLKVTTSDDKVAESKLKVLATNDDGWFVCEINAA